MNTNLKVDNHKGRGFSTKIFSVFFVISVLSIVYFNLLTESDLRALAVKYTDLDNNALFTITKFYGLFISVVLFLADIILVGPFAFLSYFGQHIKPKKYNSFFSAISLFDIGVLLALVFTINLASIHILIVDIVSNIRLTIGEMYTIIGFNIAIDILWIVLGCIKIYSYSPEQRKELSKYAIK